MTDYEYKLSAQLIKSVYFSSVQYCALMCCTQSLCCLSCVLVCAKVLCIDIVLTYLCNTQMLTNGLTQHSYTYSRLGIVDDFMSIKAVHIVKISLNQRVSNIYNDTNMG